MSDKRQLIRIVTGLSQAIHALSEAQTALEVEEPETFQAKLRLAHTWTTLAAEKQKAILDRLLSEEASEVIPSEEFRRRLANRDREAMYKAFKKRSAELRAGPPESTDA